MPRTAVAAAAFVCLIAMQAPAWSAPSGLNVIPTADVLEACEVSLERELSGSSVWWGEECRYYLLQAGLGAGVEAGIDYCSTDDTTQLNIKYAAPESAGTPGWALGVQAVGSGGKAEPYLAMVKGFGKSRLHAGLIRGQETTSGMFGFDRALGSALTLQCDHISGPEGMTSVGVAASIGESLSLTVARLHWHGDERRDEVLVNVGWCLRLGGR